MIRPYTLPQSGIAQQKMISLLKDRNKEGLDLLYETYSIALYKVSLYLICDEQKAVQVVENVFIFIWKNIETYSPSQCSLGVWLVWLIKQEVSRMSHPNAIKCNDDEQIEGVGNKIAKLESRAKLKKDG